MVSEQYFEQFSTRQWRFLCVCGVGLAHLAVMYRERAFLRAVSIIVCFLLPADTQPLDLSLCDSYVAKGNGHVCYWLADDIREWSDAQAQCRASGRTMLAITSEAENEAVHGIMSKHLHENSAIWLGAVEHSTTWKWLNGEETYQQGCYADNEAERDLDRMTSLDDDNNAANCTDYCRTKGYKYAGLQASLECWCGNTFGKYGQSTQCNMLCPINARDEFCGGKLANEIYAVFGLTSDWYNGQPNNHQNYQTCALLDKDNRFEWNDVKCAEVHGSICMLENTSAECQTRDSMFLQSYCYVINLVRETWFEARLRCAREMGGDLAMFDSQESSAILSRYILRQKYGLRGFWIGLSRTVWNWPTDDNMLFTRWHHGEPNGFSQHCSVMSNPDGFWEDVSCKAQMKYVCQKDNSTVTKVTTTSRRPPTTTQMTTNATVAMMNTTTATSSVRPTAMTTKKPFEFTEGIITAIVACAAFLVLLVAVVITWCICRRSPRKDEENEDEENVPGGDYFYGAAATVDAEDGQDSKKGSGDESEVGSKRGSLADEKRNSQNIKRNSQPPDVVPNEEGLLRD